MRHVVHDRADREEAFGGSGKRSAPPQAGKVWLVGAGPGDPELLTRKAERLLREADVVAYDELVSEEILALANPFAERIPVGRRARGCKHHEGRIHSAVIQHALRGRMVVRLKGGDPMIFGRGGEEAEELQAAGVPFEFVPGVTAALGAASSQALSLTYRNVSPMVTLATAHPAKDDGGSWAEKLAATLPRSGTIVLYMGMGALDALARALVAQGRSPETPAMVVSHATLRTERAVTGTLGDIAGRSDAANLPLPGLVIVGEVVATSAALRLRRTRPARAPRTEMREASCPPSSAFGVRAPVR
ncbi:MAG: uroporphyrinogen-III C-methyltransferase [Polyangiaceae bacterium]